MKLTRHIICVLLLPFILSSVAWAEIFSCDQKQNLCEGECRITNVSNDKGLKICKANCLGKRVSCSVGSGADTVRDAAGNAKDAGSDFGEKAKAFWNGLLE